SWRYRVVWKSVGGVVSESLPGGWLVVCGSGVVDGPVVSGLVARGAGVLVVDGVVDGGVLGERLVGVSGVVSLLDAAGTLGLVQVLAGVGVPVRVWCVTSGAVSVGRADGVVDPLGAQVWGLGRVAGLELPQVWGGLVDVAGVVDERVLGRLCGVLAGGGGEDQVAVRGSGVFGRRVVRAPGSGGGAGVVVGGTVLVTGGSGALGGHVARWVVGEGAGRVVLVSRGGSVSGELVSELEGLGAEVVVAACDVSDRGALAGLVEEVESVGGPVRAVFHAAGVGQMTGLVGMTADEFSGVLRAKVTGADNLDAVFGDRGLDAFVLFSSISAVWGSGGQGAYAAANAHLDALAERRRARGLTATSIAWGPWAEGGMADGEAAEHLRRHGLTAMAPTMAVTGLAQALQESDSVITVADVDWQLFTQTFTAMRTSPLLSELTELDEPASAESRPSSLPDQFGVLSEAERASALLDLVRRQVASVLGHRNTARIPADRAFQQLGFDSLTAVELRNLLQKETGLGLPTTLVFDCPNPAALADYLSARLFGAEEGSEKSETATSAWSDDPLVIVGMSCRLPGDVRSPEDLWALLVAEADGITGFPVDRGWAVEPNASFAREGGFLHDAASFDAEFFGISPREALAMDPQQRLLLETSWEAFERAGIDPLSVRGSRTAVFAGAASQGYASGANAGEVEGVGGHLLTGNATSVLSGRISYAFGLEGPAVTLDTACSSSLVALHLAAQALRSGECSLALVGGVTVMGTPVTFSEFSRQGGLAEDGRCKSFAEAADGTGWSEGVGVLLVERLSDARRNGHEVLAVVRASAVNQDGASNGLTAPNGPSQQRVIRQALLNAGLSASQVDVVEAHGTGTALGDPIEAQAVLATYGQGRDEARPLHLGSLKSNIGHTQAAAGVAGIIKMVLAMRHGVLPRTLHVDEPSSQVDWSAGSVELLTESVAWPETGEARRSAVSSFGISGTNAHVILEQAPPAAGAIASSAPVTVPVVPWVVSAKSEAGLSAQVERLSAFAGGHDSLDVGFSLATTRAALEHRAVLIGDRAVRGEVVEGRSAVLFSGQGAQ
ncbi:type I polyketide synthase, partial [Streptomyces sp. SM10]|uniref:type I polyketide synthase n=1 Tax=Streptomyces sp. SM10 TaxID=565556 RepID=UPI0011AFF21D